MRRTFVAQLLSPGEVASASGFGIIAADRGTRRVSFLLSTSIDRADADPCRLDTVADGNAALTVISTSLIGGDVDEDEGDTTYARVN